MKKIFILIFFSTCLKVMGQTVGSGKTLLFDGSSTKIEFSSLFNMVELPVTIEAWIFLQGPSDSQRNVFFSSSWLDGVYSGVWASIGNNSAAVSYGDGMGWNNPSFRRSTVATFSSEISNKWAHLAIVIRGATDMEVYLNGIKQLNTYSGASNLPMKSVGSCIVGFNTASNHFAGKIDDLRFWDIARTSDEIRRDKCRKLPNTTDRLLGYWQFNEGQSSTTEELVSATDGAILGNVEWQYSGAPIGDTSSLRYFSESVDSYLFERDSTSLLMQATDNNLLGYQSYQVFSPPNSIEGSSIDLSNGYYGIFPIMEQLDKSYRIDFEPAECTSISYRDGNDDLSWRNEPIDSNTLPFLEGSNVSEYVSQRIESLFAELIDLDTIKVCQAEFPLTITANSNDNIKWSDGSSHPEFRVNKEGLYWIEQNTPCGLNIDSFFVKADEVVFPELIDLDTLEVCQSDFPLTINANANENISWNDGSSQAEYQITEEGLYWIQQNTGCGQNTDTIVVKTIEKQEPFIPNVLTPNKDNLNDCFQIDQNLNEVHLLVVNRSGVVEFESGLYDNSWCPEDLAAGVYYYRLKDRCTEKIFKGWVQILK